MIRCEDGPPLSICGELRRGLRVATKSIKGGKGVLLASIFEIEPEEFIDPVTGLSVFEEDFVPADLTVNDAISTDPKAAKSLEFVAEAFDISTIIG